MRISPRHASKATTFLIYPLVVATLFGAAQGAPFQTNADLKTAVDNCLAAVYSGERCCSFWGADCSAAGTDDMPDWDTSLVTSMGGLFNAASEFNVDISKWNVSQVAYFGGMFENAVAFSQDITGWRSDVINGTDAGHYNMFQGATAFLAKFANCGNEFYDAADAGTCGIGRASDGSIGTYEASFGGGDGPPGAWQKRLSCDASNAPENGDVGSCMDTDRLEDGGTCWPTCHTGFVRVGASTCDEGEFTSATCVLPGTEGEATGDTEETELTCEISVPENGVAGDCPPSGVLETGKSCQPSCNPGYVASGRTKCELRQGFGGGEYGDAFAGFGDYPGGLYDAPAGGRDYSVVGGFAGDPGAPSGNLGAPSGGMPSGGGDGSGRRLLGHEGSDGGPGGGGEYGDMPSMGFDGPCGDYDFDGFMGDAPVDPSAHSVGDPGGPGGGMPGASDPGAPSGDPSAAPFGRRLTMMGSGPCAGSQAALTPTTCVPGTCAEKFRVKSNVCVACGMGKERAAGDDVSGGDTECDETSLIAGDDYSSAYGRYPYVQTVMGVFVRGFLVLGVAGLVSGG
mgnify:CR=1 FL=1